MAEGDGHQTAETVGSGESDRSLQKALSAHEVDLEMRAQRIAAPGDSGSAEAGTTQERIIQDSTDGSLGRQLGYHGAAHHGEDGFDGKTGVGEEPVTGGPVTKLPAASGEQTSHGMTSETKQRAQRERFGARGKAARVEAGETTGSRVVRAGAGRRQSSS
jgi:hypothetical protein